MYPTESEFVCQCTRFAFEKNYFSFQGQFYRQISGTQWVHIFHHAMPICSWGSRRGFISGPRTPFLDIWFIMEGITSMFSSSGMVPLMPLVNLSHTVTPINLAVHSCGVCQILVFSRP